MNGQNKTKSRRGTLRLIHCSHYINKNFIATATASNSSGMKSSPVFKIKQETKKSQRGEKREPKGDREGGRPPLVHNLLPFQSRWFCFCRRRASDDEDERVRYGTRTMACADTKCLTQYGTTTTTSRQTRRSASCRGIPTTRK